jgi:hypothetical protein
VRFVDLKPNQHTLYFSTEVLQNKFGLQFFIGCRFLLVFLTACSQFSIAFFVPETRELKKED